jgi:DNA-binding transcriptional ArsR family regulator
MDPVTWDADIASVGAILAEPARCRMLLALADGRALPATQLAVEAGVARSTASAHLGRLVDAGWLGVEAQGRHRYFRLARDDVADVIEAAARLAPPLPVRSLAGDAHRRHLRLARTCYGHLAGRLGVGLLAALLEAGWIQGDDGYVVTAAGADGLRDLGVPVASGVACRHCIDWTERRHHLSGHLGRALASRLFELGWVQRRHQGRAVEITEAGGQRLVETFDLDLNAILRHEA